VEHLDEMFVLVCDEIDPESTFDDAWGRALSEIMHVNGYIRLSTGKKGTLQCESYLRPCDEGFIPVLMIGGGEAQPQLGGLAAPHPTYPGVAALAASRSDKAVDDILVILGLADHVLVPEYRDWFDLYKLFEILRNHEGTLEDPRWESFKESANNHGVSGYAARHAPGGSRSDQHPKKQPSPPMSLDAARRFVLGEVQRFIAQRAADAAVDNKVVD